MTSISQDATDDTFDVVIIGAGRSSPVVLVSTERDECAR
jgi:hypothetical protein